MKKAASFLLLSLTPFLLAAAVKIVSGPILQNVSENSATFVWATDVDAMSWVELYPASENTHFYAKEREKYFDAPMGKKQIGKLHKVTVNNLKAGEKYNFRVFSKEVTKVCKHKIYYGDTASTRVYKVEQPSFSTLDNSKRAISFSVVNDIHGRADLLKSLLSNSTDVDDFIVFNGDMVSSMDSAQQLYDGFLNAATEATKSSKPVFFARGNHESRGEYSESYMLHFPTPTGKPYYTMKVGDTFFIFLDSGEDKPDSDIEYYGSADFDNYRKAQGEWLKKVVSGDDFKKAKHRIVITHIPPAWGAWHGSLNFKKIFSPILKGKGIDVFLSGHLHKHQFYAPNGDFDAPTVVNSNEEIMNVKVEGGGIRINFYDKDNKKAREEIVIKK